MSLQKLEVLWAEATRAIDGVKNAIQNKNKRLLDKHSKKLDAIADKVPELVVQIRIENAKDSDTVKRANSIESDINKALLQAEQELELLEQSDEQRAGKTVLEGLVKDLKGKADLLETLCQSLPQDLAQDVPEDARAAYIKQAIKVRQGAIDEIKAARQELSNHFCVEGAQVYYDQFTPVFNKLVTAFDTWICLANTIVLGDTSSSKAHEPSLKLDRLCLPIFDGDPRAYARFKRDFKATVVKAYADQDVQLLYLKNQCLAGTAKDSVTNIVNLDSAWTRLDERYGQSSVIVGQIVKDLDGLRLGTDAEKAIIKVHDALERAWDDVVAIDRVVDFCNVIILRTLESKLPERVQLKWLETKVSIANNSLVEQVTKLKEFLSVERKIAESAIDLRSKAPQSKYDKPKKFSGQLSGDSKPEVKPKTCFRCGNQGHVKSECRVPENIRCKGCNRSGHMIRACREKSGNPNVVSNHTEVVDKKTVKFQEKTEVKEVKACTVNEGIRLPIEVVKTNVGNCTVLYDTGSMLNIVRTSWARNHKLSGRKYSLQYRVVDGSIKTIDTTLYYIDVIGRDGSIRKIKAFAMHEVMSNLIVPDMNKLKDVVKCWKYAVDVDSISVPKGQVDLLLGSEELKLFPLFMWTMIYV